LKVIFSLFSSKSPTICLVRLVVFFFFGGGISSSLDYSFQKLTLANSRTRQIVNKLLKHCTCGRIL